MADAMSNGKKLYVAEGERRELPTGGAVVVLDNMTARTMDSAYCFNFPPNRRAGSIEEQLKHAAEEVAEASIEYGRCGNVIEFLVECLDIVECVEGVLRRYDGTVMLESAYAAHYQKNRARGDYE